MANKSAVLNWLENSIHLNMAYLYIYTIKSTIAKYYVYSLRTRNLLMGAMTNSEDPDEMPQNAAFHQGLHCLQQTKRSSENKI